MSPTSNKRQKLEKRIQIAYWDNREGQATETNNRVTCKTKHDGSHSGKMDNTKMLKGCCTRQEQLICEAETDFLDVMMYRKKRNLF